MPAFSYCRCTGLAEALEILAREEQAYPLAGGTDLMVATRGGKYEARLLLDIKAIPELNILSETAEGIFIGAAVPLNAVAAFAPVREKVSVLAEGCHSIGSHSIRNRGTLGGNICNASPAADTAAPLYCLGALVRIAGPAGGRDVPVEQFFVGPGKTALKKGELVTGVLIPKPYPAGKGLYQKASRTGSVDLATVGVAVQRAAGGVRIALGAVAPTPVRALSVEQAVNREQVTDWAAAAALVRQDISPITDLRGSREYRFHLAGVLVRRGLEAIMEVCPCPGS